VLVLAVVGVLIGRGLGLFGRERAADPGAEPGADATPPPAAPAPGGAAGPGAAAAPTPAAPLGEGPVPAAVPGAPAAAPPAGAATGSGAFDADRFASLLSSIRAAGDEGRLAEGLAPLQHARALPLDGAQRAALLVAGEELERALAAACARIVAARCEGRVLAARAAVAELFADGDAASAPVLASALQAAGLRTRLRSELPARDATWPVGKALPRGRDVRVVTGEHTAPATVVDGRTDQVTVRVAAGGGWSFPTVPALAVEPVQPTADEAVEMGLLALQQQQGMLARLWLAAAQLRSREQLPERGQRLAKILE
jgi:hypothetical protein